MTHGDDAAFDADVAALVKTARENGISASYLEKVVAAYYRRHGRPVPSPIVPE